MAGLGIPLCAAVTYAGGWLFVAGIAALAAVGAWEFGGLFAGRTPRPLSGAVVAGAALFPVLVHLLGVREAWEWVFLYPVAASLWALKRRPPERAPLGAAALTVFGALYLGGLLAFGLPLRHGFSSERLAGSLLFFLPVSVTWVADSAAFFGGRAWGRRPLAPRVSPNKTVAGAVSALIAGPLATWLYALLLLRPALGGEARVTAADLATGPLLLLGVLLAGAAILGDLVESALKRECGAKDASNLLPGHGGLLDRMDSLLWTLPVAYHVLRRMAGA